MYFDGSNTFFADCIVYSQRHHQQRGGGWKIIRVTSYHKYFSRQRVSSKIGNISWNKTPDSVIPPLPPYKKNIIGLCSRASLSVVAEGVCAPFYCISLKKYMGEGGITLPGVWFQETLPKNYPIKGGIITHWEGQQIKGQFPPYLKDKWATALASLLNPLLWQTSTKVIHGMVISQMNFKVCSKLLSNLNET